MDSSRYTRINYADVKSERDRDRDRGRESSSKVRERACKKMMKKIEVESLKVDRKTEIHQKVKLNCS